MHYRPIEVITLWGTVNRNSKLKKILIGLIFGLCFILMVVGYRRIKKGKKRDKWGKISSNNDDFDEFDQI